MTTVVTRPISERRFYVPAAFGITLIVLAGFSVDVELLRDMSSLSTLVLLHGLIMFSWIALFVTQTVFVARHRGEWHKRLMLLATIILLDAALSRFISVYTSWDLDAGIARDLLALLCVAIDSWRHRRVHPAFIVGGLLLLITDPLAHWVAATPASAWFCTWLV